MSDISTIRWNEPQNDPDAHRCARGHYAKLINNVVVCSECDPSPVAPAIVPTQMTIRGGAPREGVTIFEKPRP